MDLKKTIGVYAQISLNIMPWQPILDTRSFIDKVYDAKKLAIRIYVTEQNAKKAKTTNFKGGGEIMTISH